VTIRIGTSGWQYRDWRGPVYEAGLPQRAWLRELSRRFPTVEVNNSFYRQPPPETFAKWRGETPDGFVFAVKASRYLTHIRRLRDCEEPLAVTVTNARALGSRLGPLLFQLPPTFKVDLPRLEAFTALLPRDVRFAFEFRHASWDTDDVRAALDRVGAAWVLADRPGQRVPLHVTGGWSYVRFHQGRAERSDYPRDKLRRWAHRLAELPVTDSYIYFNNDPGGAAVRDAETLMQMLERAGALVAQSEAGAAERRVGVTAGAR
jgi:uncharacterized protein YecE (DUF72 family)